jgi:hypothetical protein
LRRPDIQNNILLRHKIVKVTRDYFDDNGFIEGIKKSNLSTEELCSRILENIHRIRPETKEFLAIE